jgi:glycosyltransferase involved in cell wall biosynthesis
MSRRCSTLAPLRTSRPTLALVTPWPPEQSGIADYNFRLAGALAAKADVAVIVARSPEQYAPGPAGISLLQAGGAAAHTALWEADAVLYCIGNSAFHAYMLALLSEHPGAVLFHDVQLTGLYRVVAALEQPESTDRAYAARLDAMYPGALAADATPPRWEELAARGIRMTRAIQEAAQRCFVHSRAALALLEADRATGSTETPTAQLPFAMPDSRADRLASRSPSLIVSVGVVTETKGIVALIDAFGLVAGQQPDLRLVVAGPGDDLERWRAYARAGRSAHAIEITGFLDPAAYAELLARADLAVQLRLVSTGEASAAIGDCLAAGLPTLVSDLGWASELPAGSVLRVPVDAGSQLIAGQIEQLLLDSQLRRELSSAALEHARSHSFERVAEAYLESLVLN